MRNAFTRVCLGGLVLACGLAGCDGTSGYRKNGGSWRYDDIVMRDVDATSFRAIDARFARDAKRGYYRGAAVFDSDGATFEALSGHEARDRIAVYWCDTFRKGQEYWSIQHLRIEVIRDADPATYRVLGQDHARDARRVYFEGVPFEVRDFATFEPLEGGFGRDAKRGYFDRIEIPGSDGASFAVLDGRYARDRTRVYYGLREPGAGPRVRALRDADVPALRALGRDYAGDARHVWYRGELVRDADAATFRIDDSYVGEVDANDRGGRWQRGVRLPPVAVASDASPADKASR